LGPREGEPPHLPNASSRRRVDEGRTKRKDKREQKSFKKITSYLKFKINTCKKNPLGREKTPAGRGFRNEFQ